MVGKSQNREPEGTVFLVHSTLRQIFLLNGCQTTKRLPDLVGKSFPASLLIFKRNYKTICQATYVSKYFFSPSLSRLLAFYGDLSLKSLLASQDF